MTTLEEARRAVKEQPDVRHIVSVSGGKDSAALAVYIRHHCPEIPAEYVFCDTGTELPETYEYLEKMEAILGIKVKHVNALEMAGIKDKPGRTAFDWFLNERYGGFLPSPRMRWCTRVLKIQPFERFVGESRCFSYIGIRADENREGYVSQKKPAVLSQQPNILPVYPFRDAGIRLAGVKQILEDSGLGVPTYYKWRSRSGCYFCFYQQKGEWQRLKEEHPDLFELAKSYERTEGDKQFTWVGGRSLSDVENDPKRYPLPQIDEDEGCAICHL
jgi:3'-phosphoadenosine 5'-phosphosulfate sulfotransferase (PAPS reductase)/FAD synthetase